MKLRIILLVLLCAGSVTGSLLQDRESPVKADYDNLKQYHRVAKHKGHIETYVICSKPNDYAVVELTDGRWFGATWCVVEKDSIPDLEEYDIRIEGEAEQFLDEFKVNFKWLVDDQKLNK